MMKPMTTSICLPLRRFVAISTAIYGLTCAVFAANDPLSPATSTALFATDTNAGMNIEKVVPGAAAMVDEHIIPMDDLIVECLRKDRSYVVDQMIQSYVLDRECEKRGINVSDAEIDKRIEELRRNLAPASLEETLQLHHMSMAELRHSFRQSIETPRLVADQIKSSRMVRCREILIKFTTAEQPVSGTARTDAEARAMVNDIQNQLKQGKDFGTLAERYSESVATGKTGDMGVLYENMLHVDASLLTAAMALNKGEISPAIKTADGYCLVQALDTGDDHPSSEDSLYQEADKESRKLQIMFLGPKTIVGLINQSKITFVKDADLIPGKPLPDAAAIIDGHPIPMQDVVAKCLTESGPSTVDILVQNYVVDRECERRGISVSEGEIDQRVDQLREQVKPRTLAEAMAIHHTTMDRLRYDFRQDLERQKLVSEQVKPTPMVHARVILVKAATSVNSSLSPATTDADPQAKTLIVDIQNELKAGKPFDELVRQYSGQGDKSEGGDLGILYAGMHGMDTAILNMALTMKNGEITPAPCQTRGGYFFLQIVSTSDNHPNDEATAYTDALAAYREERAQMMGPQAVVNLLKKSKVVYYVHS